MQRLTRVYEISQAKLLTRPETLMAYSFSWQFDGKRAYIELCRGSVIAIDVGEYSRGVLQSSITVYSESPKGCWEDRISRLQENLVLPSTRLEDYYRKAAEDDLLECVGTRLRGLSLRRTWSLWYALVVGVCQQNASFLQGWKMVYNVHVLYGKRYRIDNHMYISLPEPGTVQEDMLRRARLGYRARILAEAARILAAKEDDMGYEEVLDQLSAVKGIGSYTLGLVSLLYAARSDTYIMDRWIEALASRAYRVPQGREARREWSRRWGSWRGIASYHLTIVFDAEPLRKALKRLEDNDKCPHVDTDKATPLTLWRASTAWSPPSPRI